MAFKEDMTKLNQALDILDQTDLGLSLVWLWTWSTMKNIMDDLDWDVLVSEEEAWDLLCKAVDSGYGFTLEYGAEDHHESVLNWMIDNGLIKDFYEVDGNDEDDVELEAEEE